MIRKLSMVVVSLVLPATTLAQTPARTPTVTKGSAPFTSSADGPQMFATYCAPCHGKTGKGDGPAAPALTPRPADLTQFARTYGKGSFPIATFNEKVTGTNMSPAHGSTDMPVWGGILRALGNEELRLYNLRTYVQTLQAP